MSQQPPELALAYRYAQLIDRREFDALASIMTDDVTVIGPGYHYASLAEFQAGVGVLDQYDSTFHFVGNQTGSWSEDEFNGETYCIASHVYTRDGVGMKLDMAIRYQDRIIKSDGVFKFAARTLQLSWVQDLPLAGPVAK